MPKQSWVPFTVFYRFAKRARCAVWSVPPLLLLGGLCLTAGARPAGAPGIPKKINVAAAAKSPTYTRDVAPILYKNCVTCHRPGEVAPFTLGSYQDAKKRARMIAAVVQQRVMPPWKADSRGEFLHERRLTSAQIATLQRWAALGAPEGKRADLPPAPKFTPGWALGPPDAVLQPAGTYKLDAEGRDVYRCFVVPTQFTGGRYVSAMDVRPGNRTVVHHVIAYLDTSGQARARDAREPGPGYTSSGGGIGFLPAGMLGGWAAGAQPARLPFGTGILLPRGADVVLEVHYHKSGKPETDRTKIGLYFSRGSVPGVIAAVQQPVRYFPLANTGLRIPAGASDHEVRTEFTVPADVTVVNVFPHMHLLGRRMSVSATLPDGTEKRLIYVPDWDFNWQGFYTYKQPVRLPRGSRVRLVARYDNSAANPHNPHNPPRTITWGEQTSDEMCLAYLGFTLDAERRAAPAKAAQK